MLTYCHLLCKMRLFVQNSTFCARFVLKLDKLFRKCRHSDKKNGFFHFLCTFWLYYSNKSYFFPLNKKKSFIYLNNIMASFLNLILKWISIVLHQWLVEVRFLFHPNHWPFLIVYSTKTLVKISSFYETNSNQMNRKQIFVFFKKQ